MMDAATCAAEAAKVLLNTTAIYFGSLEDAKNILAFIGEVHRHRRQPPPKGWVLDPSRPGFLSMPQLSIIEVTPKEGYWCASVFQHSWGGTRETEWPFSRLDKALSWTVMTAAKPLFVDLLKLCEMDAGAVLSALDSARAGESDFCLLARNRILCRDRRRGAANHV